MITSVLAPILPIGVCNDIHAQYTNIIESLPHNTLITQYNGDIVLHSQGISSITGQVLIGQNFLAIAEERLACVSRETSLNEFEIAVKTRNPRGFHARSKLTQTLYRIQYVPVKNEDLIIVSADEVGYLDHEKVLLSTIDSYQIFKKMVESIKDYAIFMLDADGYVITWNKGAERLKLYQEKDIIGRHFSIFYTAEDIAKNKPTRALNIAMTENRFEEENLRLKADGSSFHARVIITPLYDDDKSLKGFVKITQDLSERAQVQRHIETEVNERSDTLRISFLAHVSHELRNMMHSVSVATDLLDETDVSDQQRPFINILLQNNLLLNQLLDDILDYSRSGATGVELHKKSMDIIHLTQNVVRPLQIINSKKISIHVEIADDVPRKVIADKTRLTQILSNILNNAIKFTEQGFIFLTLHLLRKENEKVLLQYSITDSGVGVHEEQLARLFTPFSQSKLQGDQYKGTGLGLAICKQLVEAMGGAIEMQSEFGKGTKVSFTIIASIDSKEDQKDHDFRSDSPWLSDETLSNARILIVEDNRINQLLLKRLLVKLGVQTSNIRLADDGEIAITLVKNETFDIIFMDLNMERMGGIEATRLIRQHHPIIPIYAMTGNGFQSDRRRCDQVGMTGFILKPLKKDILKTVLYDVLSDI